jgi:hypothetical protein
MHIRTFALSACSKKYVKISQMPTKTTKSPATKPKACTSKAPAKKATTTSKAAPAKKKPAQSKRGGSPFLADLQSLSIPFALTILSKSMSDEKKPLGRTKKVAHKGGEAPIESPMSLPAASPAVGGAAKKKSTAASKAKMEEIRKEFASITSAIQQFLNKY